MRKVEKSADGASLSQITKTDRFTHSGSFSIKDEARFLLFVIYSKSL